MLLILSLLHVCNSHHASFHNYIIPQNLRDRKLGGPKTCKDMIPDGTEFTIDTSWKLDKMTAVSYPCSGSYAKNFAANPSLLDDVMEAVGPCFSKCNIDNGSYVTDSVTGFGNLSSGVLDKETCAALDESSGFGFEPDDACTCNAADGPISGCKFCEATVTFNVKNCLDIAP